jgi:hypothetical protein
MLCPKCNASNAAEAIRCAKCGAPLDSAAPAGYGQPGQVAAVAGDGLQRSTAARAGHYLAILGLILGLAPVGYMIVLFQMEKEKLADEEIQLAQVLLYCGLGLGCLLGLVSLVLGYRSLSSAAGAPGGPSRRHALSATLLGGVDFVVFLAGVILVATLYTNYLNPRGPKLKKPDIQVPAGDKETEPK